MSDWTWIDERIEACRPQLEAWFAEQRTKVPIPIYGSVDVRDAGWKVSAVDANHFPAGFNNVPADDEERLAALLRDHILRTHEGATWVHLYPESHTRNPGYVENLGTLLRLLAAGGFRATLGSADLNGLGSLTGLTGLVPVDEVTHDEGLGLLVGGMVPDVVLLNNDLTTGLPEELSAGDVMPPPEMGWHRRRKSEHQAALEPYVKEVAALLGIDPWHLMTEWFVSEDKCLDRATCREILAAEVDTFLERIAAKYAVLGIEQEPVAFVKNDRGTYGLGIMAVRSGDELLAMSNRKMKRLMYAKGGADVENFLIQEGVPTSIRTADDAGVLEPVVYLVDGEAASWFYRANAEKGDLENLNSPSSSFLHEKDVDVLARSRAKGRYALVAELSMLAMGAERLNAARRT